MNDGSSSNSNFQNGFINLNSQGNTDSPIDVNIIVGKSYEYDVLAEQLRTLKNHLSYIPKTDIVNQYEVEEKIKKTEELIEQLKKNVLRQAEIFNTIEINTERLIKAKEHFDKGEFSKSGEILEAGIDELNNSQKRLLEEQTKYQNDILPKLKLTSEEFRLLALSTRFNDKNFEKVEKTRNYFESSVKSFTTKENLLDFAEFLKIIGDRKFISIYERLFDEFVDEMTKQERTATSNNLALAYLMDNELAISKKDKILGLLSTSLKLYEELSKESDWFLGDLATVNQTFGSYYHQFGDYEKAEKFYSQSKEIFQNIKIKRPDYYHKYSALLSFLTIFYVNGIPNKGLSCSYALELLAIYNTFLRYAADAPQALKSSQAILKNWGMDDVSIFVSTRWYVQKLKEALITEFANGNS